LNRVARAAGLTALATLGTAAAALARSTAWFASLGAKASGQRLDRMRRSRQWAAGRFENASQTRTMLPDSAARTLRLMFAGGERRYPQHPIPVEPRLRRDFDVPPQSGLRATWMGHASALIEIDGLRLLTDPVWSERVSPSTLVGPRRFFEPPIALDDLPPIDAVVISHDHYDHLDMETVKVLARCGALLLVPLGVGAHLEKWDISEARIRELDWGERTSVGGVTFTQTPARHFSGRRVGDRDATLWCSWVIASDRHSVFYSGDSGYFDGYREIGREHGPFDLTLMSVGAYGPTWPLIHGTPEEIVQAHVDLHGELLLPVHWATFNLAFHGWNEPAARTLAAAAQVGAKVTVPRPGQMVEPARPPQFEEWWRE
jgi:L-ascorbate metabolism protein UlaG (beta-lactamase superfamily)